MNEQLTLLDNQELKGRLEAMLFAAGEPVALKDLSAALQEELPVIETALRSLQSDYETTGRGLQLKWMDRCCRLSTKPIYYENIAALLGLNQSAGLSKAAMETLAIVAYRQPVTRVEIEGLRGVSSSSSLQLLSDRGLITEAGRKDAPGRPFLYKTTEQFLAAVGIESLGALPSYEDFAAQIQNSASETLEL